MKAVLIDANSLIYRTYHALPSLKDSYQRPVQAVYGLASILMKFIKEDKFDFIFAFYDRPEPTFRHQVYEEYKATRPKTTDDLKIQISLSKKIFSAFNIPIIEKIGYEADDLIATVRKKIFTKVNEIIILSGDLDTLQLVDEKTKVLTMQKGITKTNLYDLNKVKEKYGIQPEQIPDYKALVGDASDNIIGISGIGPKSAQKLLKKYGNLEKVIEAAEKRQFDPELNKKILENKEKLLFNKNLVKLVDEIEIDDKLLIPYSGFQIEKLLDCFQEFGFQSLIKRLKESSVEKIEKENIFNLQPKTKEVSLNNIKPPFFFFLDKDMIKIIDQEREIKVLSKKFLKDIFFYEGEKFVFDLKNIFKEILKEDFYFDKKINLKNFYDLKIIFWLLNPEKKEISLEKVVYFYKYNSSNFLIDALEIGENLLAKLKETGLDKIYFELELPLIPILARVELRGIKIDVEVLQKFKKEINENLNKILEDVYNLAQTKFNLNSPSQLREVLFEKLKINPKGLQKTSKGEISTQESELVKIAHLHPIIPKILEYRKMSKILTTYISSFLGSYDHQSFRIYPTFNQTGAITGRIITENPNLQNLPLEGDLSQTLRKVFVPENGFVFISADYSQIELRLLAHLSQDENLINAFKQNLDIHSQTAKLIFGNDLPENRRKAKIINFSIIYGISPRGLAERLFISLSQAQELIKKFFYFYPRVKKYQEEMINFAQTYSYVKNLFGRQRFLPEINYQSYQEKNLAQRIAINFPIQSLAADIFKKAIIEIDNWIFQNKIEAYLVLTIHDELIFEVKEEIKETFKFIIKEKMENVIDLSVPLLVKIKEGYNLEK
jgi:DNA polymerase-1